MKRVAVSLMLVCLGVGAAFARLYDVERMRMDGTVVVAERCLCIGGYAMAESFPVQHLCHGFETCRAVTDPAAP